jgi:hypothetical protein
MAAGCLTVLLTLMSWLWHLLQLSCLRRGGDPCQLNMFCAMWQEGMLFHSRLSSHQF